VLVFSAVQIVLRRIYTALRIRRWNCRPIGEEILENVDSVSQVYPAVVIGISSVEAGWGRAISEQIAQGEDGVGDVYGVVGVGVGADKSPGSGLNVYRKI
jgi:hypothetical protein